MSDTLEIFGQEWTGVTGFKATDDNDTIKTFIRPQGTISISANATGIDVSQYASADVAVPSSSPTIESLTVTPTTSQQTFNASGVDGYKPVIVNAMPSGTAGTPTATKGTVSNHQVAITPSVTNTTGYITGGTETGTPVTVTAAELASGSKTITQNGTDIDVVGYSTVDVAVPSTDFVVTVSWNSSTNLYESDKTFAEIQTAYNAGKTIAVKAGTSETSGTSSSSIISADGEYHTGTTPYFEYWVREYVDGASPETEHEKGYRLSATGTTMHNSYTYIIPSGNLAITQNGNNIDVANYSTVSVNVSGSSKNIQVNSGSNSVRNNGYISTGHTLTVAKTGTYNVSWTAWRSSSSGTMGTNLHVNSTTGTNQQTWTNTYGQHIVLSNQSYTEGDVLTLYATSGSTSRYCWVAGLTIEEQ